MNLDELKFDENGLIPVVAVDCLSGEVLTLAYANREAIEKTIETGFAHYWSRSRNKLWKKGETSGNLQEVVAIKVDCDRDALLYEVIPKGPACHTGKSSCFFTEIHKKEGEPGGPFLLRLEEILKKRKEKLPEGSYTAGLFRKGKEAIGEKLMEESEEFIHSLEGKREEVIWEASDLLFFLLVGCVWRGVSVYEVLMELKGRYGKRRGGEKG